jgi:predicted extracellular nuclease
VKKILVSFFLLFSVGLFAQNDALIKPARIVFYNTENLFDTIDDPDTKDEEFLPASRANWNTEKYQRKLNNLAKVLAAVFDTVQPLVIGLSEVENTNVLLDLIAQPALKKFKLGIIHHNSPDERGIDVAFLYNKELLESVFDASLRLDLANDKTRDILYFKAYVTEEYPIWFFVNHWPSRREKDNEPKRMMASNLLKSKIDNVLLGEPYARIVVMGDFNDNAVDSSVKNITQKDEKGKGLPMVNLMDTIYNGRNFSVKFKEANDVFDQFIVSKNLLDGTGEYFIRKGGAHIYNPPWLLYNHARYGPIPNRTYASGKWVGGYSDHLPVYFDVVFK